MVVYTYVHKHVRTTWYSTSQYLPVKSSQIVKVFSCQIAPCSHCPGAKDSISSQISSESQSPCGHRKQSFETDMNLGRYRTHHHTTSSWCLSDVNLSLDFFHLPTLKSHSASMNESLGDQLPHLFWLSCAMLPGIEGVFGTPSLRFEQNPCLHSNQRLPLHF